jgi:hypothetical protein
MSTPEPGLDVHEWISEFESIQEDMESSPSDALDELDRLVERMLVARGYAPNDPVADDGDDPEVLSEFRAAREIRLAVDRGDDVGPGDVAAAINGYRNVFDAIITERPAP